MDSIEYMGFCGVDCSACVDMASGKCPGCRQSIGPEGERCMIADCCIKNGVEHCAQCSRFVCGDMAEFFTESEGHRLAYRRLICMKHQSGSEI